jgi:DNA processing protein
MSESATSGGWVNRPTTRNLPESGGPGAVASPAAALSTTRDQWEAGSVGGEPAAPPAAQPFPDALTARAYLVAVAEPPAAGLNALVAAVGPVEAADRVRRGAVPELVLRETRARRAVDPAAILRATSAVGARLITPEDGEWPTSAFLAFHRCGCPHLCPPLALWVRGRATLGDVVERSAAIVGARAATGYGVHVATSLGYGVAEAGCAVVSGAAYGIDAAAHRGALAAAGLTVAVLACGVNRVYPAGHARLLRSVVERGLVVSEYPPGSVPARNRFLVRNRLIAGLAAGTVVVEAGWRSGALRTASDAGLLGRPVMAVPGPVTSAMSEGSHRLLREPGTLAVTRAEEVVEAVGRIGADLAPPVPVVCPTAGEGMSALRPLTLRVFAVLSPGAAKDAALLSAESGVPLDVVRSALSELRDAGLATRASAGWLRPAGAGGGGRGGA